MRRIGWTAWVALTATGLTACANPYGAESRTGAAMQAAPAAQGTAAPTAPAELRILFAPGQSYVDREGRSVLDQAVRLFRELDPRVVTVSGQSDTTGDPRRNLLLSQARATTVARALMDRGVPATRLEIVARGEASLLVATADDVPQAENRAVVITWRK
jgi:OOP family OmpA-OmpF porin